MQLLSLAQDVFDSQHDERQRQALSNVRSEWTTHPACTDEGYLCEVKVHTEAEDRAQDALLQLWSEFRAFSLAGTIPQRLPSRRKAALADLREVISTSDDLQQIEAALETALDLIAARLDYSRRPYYTSEHVGFDVPDFLPAIFGAFDDGDEAQIACYLIARDRANGRIPSARNYADLLSCSRMRAAEAIDDVETTAVEFTI